MAVWKLIMFAVLGKLIVKLLAIAIISLTQHTLPCVQEEISAAYRRLSRIYHPDRQTDVSPELQNIAIELFRKTKRIYEGFLVVIFLNFQDLNPFFSPQWSRAAKHLWCRRSKRSWSERLGISACVRRIFLENNFKQLAFYSFLAPAEVILNYYESTSASKPIEDEQEWEKLFSPTTELGLPLKLFDDFNLFTYNVIFMFFQVYHINLTELLSYSSTLTSSPDDDYEDDITWSDIPLMVELEGASMSQSTEGSAYVKNALKLAGRN